MWLLSWYSSFGIFVIAFVVWMLVYCIQHDPDRQVWVWIIIILFPPVGAVLYFFIRYLPTRAARPPRWMRRFLRGKELRQLEWKCRQIGNAHQWVEYGDALREVSRWDDADAAYRNAVERDRESLPALWGLSVTSYRGERYDIARDHLTSILAKDDRYKFGDASLLLGKCYLKLGETENAREILAKHVQAHRSPEAVFLLGKLQADAGESEAARATLQSVIDDLENAPRAIVRKSMFWRSRAKKLLRTIK